MIERLALKHYERGRQFEIQDRVEEAVEAYTRACALEPLSAEPYLALGRLRAGRGQFQAALEVLDAAVGRGADAQAREWRAYVLGRLRRYDEALADYRAVLEEGDPLVRVNLGRMLLALHRFDEAEDVLHGTDDPAGELLLGALPRYREFAGERLDDMRTTRYLFGRTLLLGTAGDGGLTPAPSRYVMLSARHIATTMRRFLQLADEQGWTFDGVVGDGAHHGPVAEAMSRLLDRPVVDSATAGMRVLLCSAVVNGTVDARRLTAAWRKAGAKVMHLALGLVPDGDPDPAEPDLIGFAGRCAPFWYRVEPYARLVEDQDAVDSPWPGFRVGPAVIDPNVERVAETLIEAVGEAGPEPTTELIFGWYARHRDVRAFEWSEEEP